MVSDPKQYPIVFVCGSMGSGKTTTAKIVGQKMKVIETDWFRPEPMEKFLRKYRRLALGAAGTELEPKFWETHNSVYNPSVFANTLTAAQALAFESSPLVVFTHSPALFIHFCEKLDKDWEDWFEKVFLGSVFLDGPDWLIEESLWERDGNKWDSDFIEGHLKWYRESITDWEFYGFPMEVIDITEYDEHSAEEYRARRDTIADRVMTALREVVPGKHFNAPSEKEAAIITRLKGER